MMASRRTLLVEDYEPFRRLVSSLLRRGAECHLVAEAADGMEGVQKAEELKPDLVLLDIGLPKLNGINACRLIRRATPESKVVFLTQQTDIDVVNAALDAGALAYVKKSRTQSDLMQAIEAVLEGRQFVSDGLKIPVFDIFRGTSNKEAAWEETVRGLSSARERMETIARLRPGNYFVFSRTDHSILAKTTNYENFKQMKTEKNVA